MDIAEKKQTVCKVKFAGICGSDVNKLKQSNSEYNPLFLGHEIVCVDNHNTYYVVNPFVCNNCNRCSEESLNHCSLVRRIGSNFDYGGYSGYVKLPKENLFALPASVEPKIGVLTDGIAVIMHSLHYIDSSYQRVAIIGSGSIALLFALVYNYYEPNKDIVFVCRNKKKEEFISNFYSNVFKTIDIDSFKASKDSFDLIIEAVGGNQSESIDLSIDALSNNGRLIVLGAFDDSVCKINNLRNLFFKQISVKGINSYCLTNNDFEKAFKWTLLNSTKLERLITDEYHIKRNNVTADGIKQIVLEPHFIKGVIVYE